jgi:hypothetical protein
MLRKLSAALVAVLFSTSVFAASVPILTGPNFSDASQILGSLNTLIQSLNFNVEGLVGSSPTQATTTGTSIQALGTVTIPGGQLATAGQSVRVKCFGTGTATGTNTLTVQVGASAAYAIAGVATTAGVFNADVFIMKTGANTQQIYSAGNFNVTLITPTIVSGTNTDTAGINVVCSGTTTTTGNFTLNAMTVEQIK